MKPADKIIAAAEAAAIGSVADDQAARAARLKAKSLQARYDEALKIIAEQQARIDLLTGMAGKRAGAWAKPPRRRNGKATAVLMLSDWHCEQSIRPERVSGLNEYNLDVADKRIRNVFDRSLLLLEDARHLVPITDMVVWLGGDIIHGDIHEEYASENTLHPFEACRWAAERIESGLRQIIEHGDLKTILVVTNHGNHGRTTKKMPSATAAVTSYEHNMYLGLRSRFGRELDWQIGEGYFNYVEIQERLIRFHHGERIKFGGGINGVGVPAYRFIANANTKRRAYADVFGHFHCFGWPGCFVSNGCLPGVDEYSQAFNGDSEPKQGFLVIDKDRGLTRAMPVFCR